jgi:hypothetical protein
VTRASRAGILLLLVALLAGGCSSAHRGLPRQGLVIATPKAVLLVGLDGRVLQTLDGYRLAPETGDVALDGAVQASIGASYAADVAPILLGPRGRIWQLAGGKLVPIPVGRIPLPGGAAVEYHLKKNRDLAATVRDGEGRLLVPSGSESWFVNGDLLATRKVVTDLVTGEKWRLRPGASWTQGVGQSSCNPAGIERHEIVAVCAAHNVVRVYTVAHDGRRKLRGAPFTYGGFGAMAALLSPDAKHVAATLAVGCGLSPSLVAPVDGGTPRYIDGSSDAHPGAYAQSYVLGWTPKGKIVAWFAHGECDKTSPPAVDLVDPASFGRAVVYRPVKDTQGFALWGG